MAKRLTDDDKLLINNIYYKTHNYAEVARQTGFSASTVRKYVIPDFMPSAEIEINKFKAKDIPEEVDLSPFIESNNLGDFCILSEEENEAIKELWKELIM